MTFDFVPDHDALVLDLTPAELHFTPTHLWSPSPSREHRTSPYPLPKSLVLGIQGNEENGAKFSPPPYAAIVEGEHDRLCLSVVADAGWHRWNELRIEAGAERVRVILDLEGHTDPASAAPHVQLQAISASAGESRLALLTRALREGYPAIAAASPQIPDWWLEPIYCGWGDQVSLSMWLEGVGPEHRALAYCIQGLYERWIRRLDQARVPFGTTIIDHGWAPAGSMKPDTIRWPDLRGFIDREHQKGRKVLLWVATWLWDGLPDEWCIFCDGVKLVADPTNPAYLAYLDEQITWLISEEGLDADGFKIDQLAYSPDERNPRGGSRFGDTRHYPAPATPMRPHGDGWGCELLHTLQKRIYDAAKAAKPDCLITSSTVHPYFHDTFDMTRLHDMGSVAADIFDAMQARADLSLAAVPGKPIDTDDWIHTDYAKWLNYTSNSRRLGVPCIFYAEHFMANWFAEPATSLIPLSDLEAIGNAWREQPARR